MPLAIRYDGKAKNLSIGGDYIVLCDHCGKEIDHEHPGNVESEKRDQAPLYFLHNEKCSRQFRHGKPPMVYNNIVSTSHQNGTFSISVKQD